MSPRVEKATWSPAWLTEHVAEQAMSAWRGVEDQHIASTMRLVDSAAEQDVLEQLLEGSKPPAADHPPGQHYLLFTPFRYRPAHPSRFRKAGTLGVWYGARELKTAAAEVAYWRWRFIMDSAGLVREALITRHTFFEARVHGPCVDLTAPPWSRHAKAWQHPSDYGATQALAEAAAQQGVHWVRYASVRDEGGVCAVALTPFALSASVPMPESRWQCKATRSSVMMSGPEGHLFWDFG